MECLNCGFENIPGTPTCARCQSVLNLGDVAVVPRRASSLRVATRLLRVWYWFSTQLPTLSRLLPRWRPVTFEPVPWRALALTLVVPGLGHLHEGHRRFGRVLLGLWLLFLLLAVATVAGPWSIWWLMGAITVHATALISLQAANLAFERILVRLLFGALLFLSLQWFVYRPITWLAQRVVVPLRLVNFGPGPVLSSNDGILYEGPWLRPATFARGDVVVYSIGGFHGRLGHVGFIMQEGFGVDRVIGLPGERVQFQNGVLMINGAPLDLPVTPLGGWPFAAVDVMLGPYEYAIFPSQWAVLTPHAIRGGVPPDMLRPLTVVREDRILGRVLLRVQPWRHAGTVR
jgi:hypothetical protein